jgi:hypothetical protein
MKKLVAVLILAFICLTITASAGARLGKEGYAVRDDNAIKEIQAIKLQLNSLTRDVKAIQDKAALQDRNSNDVRLNAQEAQIAEVWKWLTLLYVIVLIVVLGAVVAIIMSMGKRIKKTNKVEG